MYILAKDPIDPSPARIPGSAGGGSYAPDFRSRVKRCRSFNIMDNMLRMMETYANNLEELVAERTQQMMDEKKKADTLLYRMLPAYVCHSVKMNSINQSVCLSVIRI